MIKKLNVLFLFFISTLLQSAPADSLPDYFNHSYNITPSIFHHPEDVIFNTRPYEIDLFVEFPQKNISTVSLFLKTNTMKNYIEYPMEIFRGRFRHRFDPNQTPAESLEYFFIVTLIDYGIYAAPLDKEGFIKTVHRTLKDPAIYFKQRLSQRR